LINRHGQPIPLIDLRVVFARPSAPIDSATLFIVVQAQGKLLAMVVDEVDQVEMIALDQVQPGASPYVSGIVTQKNRLIQLVALNAVMSKLEGNYGQRTA
jgi:chemotaxis signal transduction protein